MFSGEEKGKLVSIRWQNQAAHKLNKWIKGGDARKKGCIFQKERNQRRTTWTLREGLCCCIQRCRDPLICAAHKESDSFWEANETKDSLFKFVDFVWFFPAVNSPFANVFLPVKFVLLQLNCGKYISNPIIRSSPTGYVWTRLALSLYVQPGLWVSAALQSGFMKKYLMTLKIIPPSCFSRLLALQSDFLPHNWPIMLCLFALPRLKACSLFVCRIRIREFIQSAST